MSRRIGFETESRGEGMPPRRYPIIECGCGRHVTCWDSWANECEGCSAEYNGSGQRLAHRSQWGEETGETFY